MYKTPLRNFVSGTNKKEIQRHPIIMTDADYDYILDEIEPRENFVFEGNVGFISDKEYYL